MRLLVVGKLNGQLSTAVKMAMSAGAKVSHVETIAAATHALRAGQGADLMMVDFELDRKVGEAIDIYVNNRLVARGEVVLVEDKLGVTMTEVINADRT